jgi:DNA repair protein RadA/Sms
MKSKETFQFQCQSCEAKYNKWYGKCQKCDAWGTIAELQSATKAIKIQNQETQPQTLEYVLGKISAEDRPRRLAFESKILNEFWNGGITGGSFVLLAGEPGLGKSTVGLQLLRSIYAKNQNLCLYISAEESLFELARRAERLGIPKQVTLLQSNSFEQIHQAILQSQPSIVVLDSVQTFYSGELSSSPGSVMQVSYLASELLNISKNYNITIILIGHVTKDGQIAGPKTLEHLVDSVIMLEKSEVSGFRTMTFTKNRYGSTDSQLLLKMNETGLEIITNPSLVLLENLEQGIGVAYGMAIEKNVPLVVEIQSLVSKPSSAENAFGRREAINFKASKLNTILAIAEKYLGVNLRSRDVYVQISGMAHNLQDDSLDLVILLSILSSYNNINVDELLGTVSVSKAKEKQEKAKPIFAARLTLSGQIRSATSETQRSKTAIDLGFNYNPSIVNGDLKNLFGKSKNIRNTDTE